LRAPPLGAEQVAGLGKIRYSSPGRTKQSAGAGCFQRPLVPHSRCRRRLTAGVRRLWRGSKLPYRAVEVARCSIFFRGTPEKQRTIYATIASVLSMLRRFFVILKRSRSLDDTHSDEADRWSTIGFDQNDCLLLATSGVRSLQPLRTHCGALSPYRADCGLAYPLRMELPACLLHGWRETTRLVTHTSLIGEYGPVTAIHDREK